MVLWDMNCSARLAAASASSRAETLPASAASGAGAGCGRLEGLRGVTAAAPIPTLAARDFFFLTPPRLAAVPNVIPAPAGNEEEMEGGWAGASIKDAVVPLEETEVEPTLILGADAEIVGSGGGKAGVSSEPLAAAGVSVAGVGTEVVAIVLIRKSNPDEAGSGASAGAGVSAAGVVVVVAVVDIKKLKADSGSAADPSGAEGVKGFGAGADSVVDVVSCKKENPLLTAGAGSGAGAEAFKKENPLEGVAACAGGAAAASSLLAVVVAFKKPKALAAGAGAGAAVSSSLESFPFSSKPPNMIECS
jgi:hypothetical protein